MINYTVEDVRERTPHYLFPEVAQCAGMHIHELVSFSWGGNGSFVPTPEQLHQLALRMGVYKTTPEGSAHVHITMNNCCSIP